MSDGGVPCTVCLRVANASFAEAAVAPVARNRWMCALILCLHSFGLVLGQVLTRWMRCDALEWAVAKNEHT